MNIIHDGKPFEVINCESIPAFIASLLRLFAVLIATKSGGIIVRAAIAGEKIPIYSQNGLLEATETGIAGKYLATKTASDGTILVDVFGHTNTWQIDEKTLRKKYAVGDTILDGSFVKPAGGEQRFLQVDRNVAFMVPWGPNGSLIPQFIEAGGFMNITDLSDVYGISARDFADTYDVLRMEP